MRKTSGNLKDLEQDDKNITDKYRRRFTAISILIVIIYGGWVHSNHDSVNDISIFIKLIPVLVIPVAATVYFGWSSSKNWYSDDVKSVGKWMCTITLVIVIIWVIVLIAIKKPREKPLEKAAFYFSG